MYHRFVLETNCNLSTSKINNDCNEKQLKPLESKCEPMFRNHKSNEINRTNNKKIVSNYGNKTSRYLLLGSNKVIVCLFVRDPSVTNKLVHYTEIPCNDCMITFFFGQMKYVKLSAFHQRINYSNIQATRNFEIIKNK